MAKVKLRVALNKGRSGIPLGKLSRITQETYRFLIMLHADAELPGDPSDWLADNFGNDSVDFDCQTAIDVEFHQALRANQILRAIVSKDFSHPFLNTVRPATIRQFSEIATPIDPDEKVEFGVFTNGVTPEYYSLTKSDAYEITDKLPSRAEYYGEIQGTIHALYKDDKPKRVIIRELSTRNLIDCYFDDELYKDVIEALRNPNTVVFVEGTVHEDLINGVVDSLRAKNFRIAPVFDENRFNSLIGSAPNLTGGLTTEEFIERYRSNGDDDS